MSILEELTKNIIAIYDAENNPIIYHTVRLCIIPNNQRNSHNTSIRVLLDETPISLKGKKVKYKCSCGIENTILLKKYVTKRRLKCVHCSNDEEKSKNHSLYWKLGYQPRVFEEKIPNVYIFEDETENFRNEYYKKHLYSNEFHLLLPHIVSIYNHQLQEVDKIEYIEHYPVKNQFKYSPYVVINGELVPFKEVYLKCENCGECFRISDERSKRQKLLHKHIVCRGCSLVNKNFPRIKYTTIFGDDIIYQGKLEKKFVEFCEENKIRVLDGPTLDYYWNNAPRTYTIDFYLPDLRLVIEIKANHIWHRQQITNGKWNAKEKVAQEYYEKNNYQFLLLFNDDFDNLNFILRDSLNNRENLLKSR